VQQVSFFESLVALFFNYQVHYPDSQSEVKLTNPYKKASKTSFFVYPKPSGEETRFCCGIQIKNAKDVIFHLNFVKNRQMMRRTFVVGVFANIYVYF
jgi:hypothetical protein